MEVKKSPGVTFNSYNTFDNYIAKVCHACYYHLRDMQRVHKFLTVDTANLAANTMVSIQLDNCNYLLYELYRASINRLYKVENALCRIFFLTGSNESCHTYL